jgi:tetratricopeptide (TPR) repeat protein
MSTHFERARILFDQSRFDMAIDELRQALTENPDHAGAHALLALSQAMNKQYNEALTSARTAVGLTPDIAHVYYVLAWVSHQADMQDEAEHAIREAIQIDPEEADYYGTLGSILIRRKRWEEALAVTDKGLAYDPEHVMCANLRAMALTQLGRKDEAEAGLETALFRDPENAWTHANRGWQQLQHGDQSRGMDHFREALRIDPSMDWAREGIVAGLKAQHVIYRMMLKYFFWMGKLRGRAQWGVILGAYIVFRLLREAADANPSLAPFVTPFLILYAAFVLLSWTADPLFNLMLRLSRNGRLALSDEQIFAANCIGLILLGALGLLSMWMTMANEVWLIAAVGCAAMIIPVSGIFKTESATSRKILLAYTLILTAVGLLALLIALQDLPLAGLLTTAFLIGWVLYSWIANVIIMKER